MPARTRFRSILLTSFGTSYGVSISATDQSLGEAMERNGLFPNDGPKSDLIKIAQCASVAKHLNGGKPLLFLREKMKALRVLPLFSREGDSAKQENNRLTSKLFSSHKFEEKFSTAITNQKTVNH